MKPYFTVYVLLLLLGLLLITCRNSTPVIEPHRSPKPQIPSQPLIGTWEWVRTLEYLDYGGVPDPAVHLADYKWEFTFTTDSNCAERVQDKPYTGRYTVDSVLLRSGVKTTALSIRGSASQFDKVPFSFSSEKDTLTVTFQGYAPLLLNFIRTR